MERVTFYRTSEVVLGVVDLETCERLGCGNGDVEGIVELMVFTQGVELACLCVEKNESLVKLSLRSRQRVDAARLARQLCDGGGGHPRAAGGMIPESLSGLLSWLPSALCEATRV